MKKVIILGGGGFIGGHLANRLKKEGNWVRICDIKEHEYWNHGDICDEFLLGDLRDPNFVASAIDNGVDEECAVKWLKVKVK